VICDLICDLGLIERFVIVIMICDLIMIERFVID